MFSKGGTKWLLIAVLAMVAIYFISENFGSNATERTFKGVVMSMDTTAVSSIEFTPAGIVESYTIESTDGAWRVKKEGQSNYADQQKVQQFIRSYAELRTLRYAGKGESIRKKYNLTDSLASKVEFHMTDGSSTGLETGSVSSLPSAVQGGPNELILYVSRLNEEEIYAVPTSIEASPDQKFDQWRYSHLMQSDTTGWQLISFEMMNDTGYVLEKHGSLWLIGADTANGASVTSFMTAFTNARVPRFAPMGIELKDSELAYRLRIERATGSPLELKVYAVKGRLYGQSSENMENVFEFDHERDIPRMFRPKSIFLSAR